MIRATSIIHSHDKPADTVTLTYDERFRRRVAMVGDNGTKFLLDLAEAVELRDGDHLVLEDARHIRVIAAPEDLMRASADDPLVLARAIWHVGNRHLPCEIAQESFTLRFDHVIEKMLIQLGVTVTAIKAPFNPEGGAYGQGRTHGHSH